MQLFGDTDRLLRSTLVLESLDLGVLTPAQYRFVARRTKQSDALVERHMEKLFSAWAAVLGKDRSIRCVSIPVFPRVCFSGKLSSLLFAAFHQYPAVDPKRLCIELSSDILFEDFAQVKEQLIQLRAMGVKIAISEVGDDFCPLTRLAALSPDMVFADSMDSAQLQLDDSPPEKLAKYLHIAETQVFMPAAAEPLLELGRQAGFDGYTLTSPLQTEHPEERL